MHPDDISGAALAIANADHPLALTGAGVSTASGLPDFRSPTGLWATVDPARVAREDVLRQQPERFWSFYAERFRGLRGVEPNRAHAWLADMEARGLLDGIITQNVDGLHQRAGSRCVWELHGSLTPLRCVECAAEQDWVDVPGAPTCQACGGLVRPGVVLFGEALHADLDDALVALADCDLLLVLGSSLQVTPAASLPACVLARGGRVIVVNRDPTSYDEVPGVTVLRGEITDVVDALDDALGRVSLTGR